MGKKPITILKVKDVSIYPFLIRSKTEFKGVNIRVSRRVKTGEKIIKGKTKYLYKHTSIDIEVYDKKGQRIVVKPKDFENGQIKGNDSHNILIKNYQGQLASFVEKHKEFNKEILFKTLYGDSFNHKRKRTKYITIPVTDKQGTIHHLQEVEQKEVKELLEGVDLDEQGVEDEDDFHRLITGLKLNKEEKQERKRILEEMESMTPSQRYEKGYYNKNDIFEVLANYKFNPNIDFAGDYIIIKFFDWKVRSKSKIETNVSKINYQWFRDCCDFILNQGYSDASTIGFNPFNLNSERILEGSIEFYSDPSFEKFLKWLRQLLRMMVDEKVLTISEREIKKLTPHQFKIKNITQKTKRNEALEKDEFDKIFNATLKTAVTKKETITKEELTKVRDIFVLMTWFGGLRPKEYNKDNLFLTKLNDGYVVQFFTSDKNKKEVHNPVCGYSLAVLEKYNFEIPFYEGSDTRFIALLRVIASQLNLNRQFFTIREVQNKQEKQIKTISENIHRYFARKSLFQIFRNAGISQDDTELFTGHAGKGISSHYDLDYINHKFKRDILIKHNLHDLN